jgi:hypothetical protein
MSPADGGETARSSRYRGRSPTGIFISTLLTLLAKVSEYHRVDSHLERCS